MKTPLLDLKLQHASLAPRLEEAIDKVLASTAFVGGPPIAEFERGFAAFCETKHAIGCANGTDAIEMGLHALGVGKGDRVVTVSHTFIATVEAILNVGAEPILIDVDPHTLVMDTHALAETMAKVERVRAIVPVHLYGNMVAMDRVVEIARRYDAAIVEDAAQAHGARYQGKRAGAFGHLATFSFFPGKNLGALGDAGGIVTSDDALARRLSSLRDHGRREKYVHDTFGRSSRLDPLQAAVLSVKLAALEGWNQGRRAVAARYDEALPRGLERVGATPGCEHVYHQYVVRHASRDSLRQALSKADIDSGVHYPVPVHKQPAWKAQGLSELSLPHTERACEEVFSLPVFPELTGDQQGRIVQVLSDALR